MVTSLTHFASEVIFVARQVGTEGKLGVQAKVVNVEGTWQEITFVDEHFYLFRKLCF